LFSKLININHKTISTVLLLFWFHIVYKPSSILFIFRDKSNQANWYSIFISYCHNTWCDFLLFFDLMPQYPSAKQKLLFLLWKKKHCTNIQKFKSNSLFLFFFFFDYKYIWCIRARTAWERRRWRRRKLSKEVCQVLPSSMCMCESNANELPSSFLFIQIRVHTYIHAGQVYLGTRMRERESIQSSSVTTTRWGFSFSHHQRRRTEHNERERRWQRQRKAKLISSNL